MQVVATQSTHKLRVGFDFDGVIAYNPLRIIRPLMSALKLKKVVKRETLVFFQPKNFIEELLWWLAHQSSFMPARGLYLLKNLVQTDQIEPHLLTGRTTSLKPDLFLKLHLFGLEKLFRTVNITSGNEQPHLFKERMIKDLQLDVFIEDNFDIVQHLVASNLNAKIIWISNALDKNIVYPHKYFSLADALVDLARNELKERDL